MKVVAAVLGIAILLMGGVAFVGGLAITLIFFPVGMLVGFPVTILGGVVGSLGLVLLGGAAGGFDDGNEGADAQAQRGAAE